MSYSFWDPNFSRRKISKGLYRFGRVELGVIKLCNFRWGHSLLLRVDVICDRTSLHTCKFLIFLCRLNHFELKHQPNTIYAIFDRLNTWSVVRILLDQPEVLILVENWHLSYFWTNFGVLEDIVVPISIKIGTNVKLGWAYHIRQENTNVYHLYQTIPPKSPNTWKSYSLGIFAQNTILEHDYDFWSIVRAFCWFLSFYIGL